MAATEEPTLHKRRHVKYWDRFLHHALPGHLVSQESIRPTLIFFIVASLDLLAHPEGFSENAHVKEALLARSEKQRIQTWVLSLQHPDGGFCGSPNMLLPPKVSQNNYRTAKDYGEGDGVVPTPGYSASANVAATCFALLLLGLVAEDVDSASDAFRGVDRTLLLRWLRKVQRPDGSFGEVVTDSGYALGGRDMRQCYMAASIRWMLRGGIKEGEPGWVEDIDVDGLAKYIRQAQSYDGGIAESSWHEPHAGYAYCAISALYMLDRSLENGTDSSPGPILKDNMANIPSLLRFLAQRQFALKVAEEGDEQDVADGDSLSLDNLTLDDIMAGCNGRWNKAADTCYTWWVNGSLTMLGHSGLINRDPSRRFLLSETQHTVGGFAKYPGGQPDPYHGYMGLIALASMGEPSLKPFDSSLCVSVDTVRRIEHARAGLIAAEVAKAGFLQDVRGHLAKLAQRKRREFPEVKIDPGREEALWKTIGSLGLEVPKR